MRVRHDTSTKNLLDHVKGCKSKTFNAEQSAIKEFTHGYSYSSSRMRYLLGLWVARRFRPYNIVKDDELIQIFKMLYSKVEIPSPSTLSRDIIEMFAMSKESVKKYLMVR